MQPRMKKALQDIRNDAYCALSAFRKRFEVTYLKASDCLLKEKTEMLTFYDYRAEHWIHIRTTTQ